MPDTDGSADGAGAAVSRCLERPERIVAHLSETFDPYHCNYCIMRKELLVVRLAVGYFGLYL